MYNQLTEKCTQYNQEEPLFLSSLSLSYPFVSHFDSTRVDDVIAKMLLCIDVL